MRRHGRRNARKGETIAMVVTSVFVLGVLTFTGVYIKNRNMQQGQDGYYVDFDALETELNDKIKDVQAENEEVTEGAEEEQMEAVQSGHVEKEPVVKPMEETVDIVEENIEPVVSVTPPIEPATPASTQDAITNLPTVSFSEEESLVWPVVGNVLINFSMDKSVYFKTLDQYKYSPAMVIEATEGEQITAAADAIITNIYTNNELGNIVEMDLGDGYKLTYGQLQNIVVNVGQYVEVGQLIGQVAKPTVSYSLEGCNVYFKLTKDGEAINPMNLLE